MRRNREKESPQWDEVETARGKLRQCEGYPVLESLEETWTLIDECLNEVEIGGERRKVVDRDRLSTTSAHPLSALMFMVEMGIYPPPELLLGLLYSWRTYMDAGGEKTLEEVFLGKPKRKGGNYAMREAKEGSRMWLSHELDRLTKEGATQAKAAEQLANQYSIKIDPDSLVRVAREYSFSRLIKKKKKAAP